jgi:hypothetical protein
MSRHDRIAGLIWLALGSGMAIDALRLGVGSSRLPGVGFMPLIAGIALGACGAIMAGPSFLGERQGARGDAAEQDWKKLAWPIAALLAFVLLLAPLGFFLATFLLQLFLLKLSDRARWVAPVAAAIAIAAIAWLVFAFWLKIPLPAGLWVRD